MKTRARPFRVLMLGVATGMALVFLWGCTGRRLLEFPLESACEVDKDCISGQVCQLGYCRARCPPKCDEGKACVLDACYARECPDETCVGDEVCIREHCADPRCGGESCTPAVCEPGSGLCVECIAASMCPVATPICDQTSHTCICEDRESDCSDGIDGDCDTARDCEDDDCWTEPGCECEPTELTETVCHDEVDNDCDRKTDCEDTDDCTEGVSCGPGNATCSAGVCDCPGGSTETSCDNAFDDDCDRVTDCDDPDCSELCCGGMGMACCHSPPDTCDPGLLCESTTCVACGGDAQPCCDSEHDCDNDRDDDCDSHTDCDDNDCDSVCTGCGLNGEPCCQAPADPCIAGQRCSTTDICVSCGGTDEPCCDSPGNQCETGLGCDTGGTDTCITCGGSGQPCCEAPDEVCGTGLVCDEETTDTCIGCGEGGPICCTVSQSELGRCDCGWLDGSDLQGGDLTLADGAVVSGRYKRVKNFIVPAGFTATVAPYDGTGMTGQLEVCATTITIAGTLDATGVGYGGACGGHGSSCTGGGAPGVEGDGPFGGTAGSGGASSDRGAGSAGDAAGKGGYAVAAGNGDTCGDELLHLGSGGGGGGGGGSSYGPNCASYGVSGGGGGGGGGPGGGSVSLTAFDRIEVSGSLLANGRQSGDGGDGLQRNPTTNCSDPCSFGGAAGDPDVLGTSAAGIAGAAGTSVGQGGAGGAGAGGAGGGILLKAQSVVITGAVSSLGGGSDTTNGGTIKIFYRGSVPGGSLDYGKLCTSTY